MLSSSSGSDATSKSVALPLSLWSRQTKPGEASAMAFTFSRASKKGWTRGSPSGASSLPILICASCQPL
jgi:hypothetical protein